MNLEAQNERNSSEKLILGIQRELISEVCGKDRAKQAQWIDKYSEIFRQIVETDPRLVWEYPHTKDELRALLYKETTH